MAVTRSRTSAAYGVGRPVAQGATATTAGHRGSGRRAQSTFAVERARLVREITGVPHQPPRRHAMVVLGAAVLSSSVMGTVVGHMLAQAPH
jgi:hypothetical protein